MGDSSNFDPSFAAALRRMESLAPPAAPGSSGGLWPGAAPVEAAVALARASGSEEDWIRAMRELSAQALAERRPAERVGLELARLGVEAAALPKAAARALVDPILATDPDLRASPNASTRDWLAWMGAWFQALAVAAMPDERHEGSAAAMEGLERSAQAMERGLAELTRLVEERERASARSGAAVAAATRAVGLMLIQAREAGDDEAWTRALVAVAELSLEHRRPEALAGYLIGSIGVDPDELPREALRAMVTLVENERALDAGLTAASLAGASGAPAPEPAAPDPDLEEGEALWRELRRRSGGSAPKPRS